MGSMPELEVERQEQRFRQLTRVTLGLLLAAGCWLVVQPFVPAILFSLVIAVSTWPAYARLLVRVGNRPLASAIACVTVALLAILPATLLLLSVRDGVVWGLQLIQGWKADGGHPPQWLLQLPAIGPAVQAWWMDSFGSGWGALLEEFAEPARRAALASGQTLINGALQSCIGLVLLYFLYVHGDSLGERVGSLARRFGDSQGIELLHKARSTMVGVMTSVVGAGLAQATVASIGFSLAGVPNPLLLGALTFVLSMIPIGPPLLWGGASLWLFRQGEPGWGLFMAIYGLVCISLVDNVMMPLLISRSAHLPFALTLIGVIGGVIAFGVVGVFLGPILLALAATIVMHGLEKRSVASTPVSDPG